MTLAREASRTPARAAEDANDLVIELFLLARGGDKPALAELIERCEPMVRAVARRQLYRRADVDDVVQEVWIALIKNLDRIHAPEALRSWLWAVTSRFATRQSKNLARVALLGDRTEIAGEESAEDKGIGSLTGSDCRGRVRHALRRLDTADQQLLELLFAVDRPCYRSIGRIVNRPVGSIGPTRQRLLSRLRGDPELQVLGAS
jgi:RNA polymerase sigma factor (sigma-70 family)